MRGQLNGSQVRLGVKPDQVEHGNASGEDIEYHSKEVINPRHSMDIQGATTSDK